VLPLVHEENLIVFAYGPLCQGLLTGKMQPDTKFTGDDLRQSDPKFQPPYFVQYLNAVHQLDDLARKTFGKNVMDLAVRWVLDQPGIAAALWAARHPNLMLWRVPSTGTSTRTRAAVDQILRQTIANPSVPISCRRRQERPSPPRLVKLPVVLCL
jgi:aryl-alcohol dehydrogenase-like predicted oxidoreductase